MSRFARLPTCTTSGYLHAQQTDVLVHHEGDGAVEAAGVEAVGVLHDGALAVDLVLVAVALLVLEHAPCRLVVDRRRLPDTWEPTIFTVEYKPIY